MTRERSGGSGTSDGPELRIAGLAETALFVGDVPAARDFYESVLGLLKVEESPDGCVFRLARGQVLLLVSREKAVVSSRTPGGEVPPSFEGADAPVGAGHVAFGVEEDDLAAWRDRLEARGVEVSSEVRWEAGARSLYFRDPDGHLLELVTSGLWEAP